MKFRSIIKAIIPVFCVIATSCNNVGSSSINTKNGSLLSTKNLTGIPSPLSIVVESHTITGTDYIEKTNTGIYSMLKVINPAGASPVTIATAPSVANSVDFAIVTDGSSFAPNANICKQNTILQANSSCLILVKANPTGTSLLNTTLSIKTPTYNYAFKVVRNSVLYLGGDFSAIENTENKKIVTDNTTGNICAENHACLLISYNPNSHEIKRIAEMNDEIYGIAVDTGGNLIVGGAFNKVTTAGVESVVVLPVESTPRTLIAKISPVSLNVESWLKANQAVYAITNSATNNGDIYLSGAFNTITHMDGSQIIASNNKCMVAKSTIDNGLFKVVDNIDSYVDSMATNINGNQENILLAGQFNQIEGSKLDDNYSSGIVSCDRNGACSQTILPLNGKVNVVSTNSANQIIASGEYTNINNLSGLSSGDIVHSGFGINGFAKITNSTGDGAVYTITSIDNKYYLGGNFTNIAGSSTMAGTSECEANNLCTLVGLDSNTNVGETLLGANGSIDVVAPGVELTVSPIQ